MNTFHNSAEILLNSTLCLNGSLKTVWSVNFLKHWQSFHGTMYKIKSRALDQSSIFAVKSVLLASRAWKGSTTRRQWSCWRQLRTASSWWCATLPRCWRRWRLVSKNWEQRGAGNSSNCSFSNSNSSKLHSKITCRRWEYSLSSLRPSGRAGPHSRACPTTSQGHRGSPSLGTGHLSGDRNRTRPGRAMAHGWAQMSRAHGLAGQGLAALGVMRSPGHGVGGGAMGVGRGRAGCAFGAPQALSTVTMRRGCSLVHFHVVCPIRNVFWKQQILEPISY